MNLLSDVLRSVSRAFYLSLRILPPACRTPMATAYLLARAADTIADSQQLPAAARGRALEIYRDLLDHPNNKRGWDELTPLLPQPQGGPEATLLARLPECLSLLDHLSNADRGSVRDIVDTLAGGMQADLLHFPPEGGLAALSDPADLDRHTYLAAGCVGEFWTEILLRHVSSLRHWPPEAMKSLGIRFGKALQLVNVLRDLPGDLDHGRCYLPESQLREVGLNPADLLAENNWPRLQPLYRHWLALALDHFRAALKYILAIPPGQMRLRLSTLWPVLIGLATLHRLAAVNPLIRKRQKVSRAWVYRTLLLSLPVAPFDIALKAWVESWIGAVQAQLG